MNREALKELGQFTGTEHYYRPSIFPVVCSDGVKFLADNASCYWLIDEIGGAQNLPLIREDPMLQQMQFWRLKDRLENSAMLICERDSGNVAFQKEIPYTDFPFDTVPDCRIWVAPTEMQGKLVKVLYLPSEH